MTVCKINHGPLKLFHEILAIKVLSWSFNLYGLNVSKNPSFNLTRCKEMFLLALIGTCGLRLQVSESAYMEIFITIKVLLELGLELRNNVEMH